MEITIYRGTHEIGGNCIQIKADNGKVLWVDIGSPLSSDNPDVSYTGNKVDALLISHPHQDHFGLMGNVGKDVPIYLGQVTLDLINATNLFRGLPPASGKFKLFNAWKQFKIADTFTVYPYLMDHSSPEAFAFTIEADNKRVFYSGDYRATGSKAKVYYRLLDDPPKNIDLFLTEGTMIRRSFQKYPDEESVHHAINEIIGKQTNTTFVISSAQNIDRLVSVFRACWKNNKRLVIDVYNAWVLDMVKKKSDRLPVIDWDNIVVYDHPNQLKKISGDEYAIFRQRVEANKIGNSIFNHPEGYVYFLRCPNPKLIDKLLKHGRINLIYSQWEGYRDDESIFYCKDLINRLADSADINFHSIHTSGHATVDDLIRLAGAINAIKVVPIHTDDPSKMKDTFEREGIGNIELWEDGIAYQI